MKHLIPALTALIASAALALLYASPSHAANCSTYPYTLTNGQVADATQVMANFNSILTCANSSLAHNGNNSDITSLNGLLTPLSTAQGGTGNTTGAATTLSTARTFSYTGDVTGGPTSFDGSANVSTATTIANDAVTTAKILNANVTTAKIADAAVTTAKITDANVTTAKIATGAVTSTQLGASSVVAGKVGTDAVGTGNITDDAIITTKIADSAVTTAKIAAANVTAVKLAAGVAASNLGYTPVNKAGDTMSGNLTVAGGPSSGVVFNVQGFITGDNSTVTTIYTNVSNNSRFDYNWSTHKLTWIANGVSVFSVDASGNAIFKGNVTANGTP